jgi:PAS domain S-box-containing protein
MNSPLSSTILLIDDEPPVRASFKNFLEDHNYRVLTAENGKIGLDIFCRQQPDLVVVDLRMPQMDGLEVLAVLHEKSPETPVIVASGTGNISDVVEALHRGAWDFILKPIADLKVLQHAIEKALERKWLKSRESEFQERLQREIENKTSELASTEGKYRMLAENIIDVIWTTDMDFRFTYVSPSIKKLRGYDPQELIGKSGLELLTPESRKKAKEMLANDFELAREKGFENFSRTIELQQRNKDGKLSWTEFKISFLVDADKRPTSVLGISRDTTHRRQLEHRLRHAQKMEAIGTLTGGIAHDFNNILGAIIGYAELIRLSDGTSDQARGFVKNILLAGKRAKELISRILSFSRRSQFAQRPIHVAPVIKEAYHLLQASLPSTITLKINNHFQQDVVTVDTGDIHQIIMNLGTNAFQAFDDQPGTITISITNDLLPVDAKHPGGTYPLIQNPDPQKQQPATSNPCLLITVNDDGSGISEEIMPRIFDPYFTTKNQSEGTGLGLAIVHGIVRNLGGRILVESKSGVGTSFGVYIPLSRNIPETSSPSTNNPLQRGNERVLLVDDEPMLLEVESFMLSNLGYQVTTASNARKALELFSIAPDNYDLVITDLSMPEMTGLQLAGELSSIKPAVRTLLLTGNAHELSPDNYTQTGICGVARKPLSIEELAQQIREALDS